MRLSAGLQVLRLEVGEEMLQPLHRGFVGDLQAVGGEALEEDAPGNDLVVHFLGAARHEAANQISTSP